jgi:hypothetical protein
MSFERNGGPSIFRGRAFDEQRAYRSTGIMFVLMDLSLGVSEIIGG